jgi:hypothetical protein
MRIGAESETEHWLIGGAETGWECCVTTEVPCYWRTLRILVQLPKRFEVRVHYPRQGCRRYQRARVVDCRALLLVTAADQVESYDSPPSVIPPQTTATAKQRKVWVFCLLIIGSYDREVDISE